MYKRQPYTVHIAASGTMEANGEYDAAVKLFGLIPVKNVEVDVLPATEIVPAVSYTHLFLLRQQINLVEISAKM